MAESTIQEKAQALTEMDVLTRSIALLKEELGTIERNYKNTKSQLKDTQTEIRLAETEKIRVLDAAQKEVGEEMARLNAEVGPLREEVLGLQDKTRSLTARINDAVAEESRKINAVAAEGAVKLKDIDGKLKVRSAALSDVESRLSEVSKLAHFALVEKVVHHEEAKTGNKFFPTRGK